MSEMVQKVARAIRRNKFERTGRLTILDPSIISDEEMGEARAAIEAMREPSFNMICAGDCRPSLSANANTLSTWQAMIDSALTKTDPVAQGN